MVDSTTEKSSWGGKREGAGRKEGSKNKTTLEQLKVKQAFVDRVNRNADRLFNAQLDLAVGEKFLMVKRTTGKGTSRKTTIEVVIDTETIKQYLDDDGASMNNDEEFYFISTKPANGLAIDSLLNRSIGKPTEKMEIEHSGELDTGLSDPQIAAQFQEFMMKQTKS